MTTTANSRNLVPPLLKLHQLFSLFQQSSFPTGTNVCSTEMPLMSHFVLLCFALQTPGPLLFIFQLFSSSSSLLLTFFSRDGWSGKPHF